MGASGSVGRSTDGQKDLSRRSNQTKEEHENSMFVSVDALEKEYGSVHVRKKGAPNKINNTHQPQTINGDNINRIPSVHDHSARCDDHRFDKFEKLSLSISSKDFSQCSFVTQVNRFEADTAQAMIDDYNFNPFLHSDEELMELAIHLLGCYHLIETFKIKERALRIFLVTVLSLYHTENNFHNFQHAWSVMHLTYHILRNGADEYLETLDILAILIAAVCHDIDHPGNNNAFEIATNSEMAKQYTAKILESHHAATSIKLITEKELNFLEAMSSPQYSDFQQNLIFSIMATDMSDHFPMVEQLEKVRNLPAPFDKISCESRRFLMAVVLHSADIGAQTQCRELSIKWTDCVLNEFTTQAAKETKLGLTPTPFMHGLHDELKRMQVQYGFITNIVMPLWNALVVCFPRLSSSLDHLNENKQRFADRISELTSLKFGNEILSLEPQSPSRDAVTPPDTAQEDSHETLMPGEANNLLPAVS